MYCHIFYLMIEEGFPNRLQPGHLFFRTFSLAAVPAQMLSFAPKNGLLIVDKIF